MEEILAAFNELITEAKVRAIGAIGASNFIAWRLESTRQIAERNHWQSYSAVQQCYSYLRPKRGWDLGEQLAAATDAQFEEVVASLELDLSDQIIELMTEAKF